MIEHYKRLVSLVLGMHAEQATEDGTYDPQGDELAAILLAHQIRELESNQNALNQKESRLVDGMRAEIKAGWDIGFCANDFMPATVKKHNDGRWTVTWDHGVNPDHKWSAKGGSDMFIVGKVLFNPAARL